MYLFYEKIWYLDQLVWFEKVVWGWMFCGGGCFVLQWRITCDKIILLLFFSFSTGWRWLLYMTGISFPVIVCFKELVYMVMKFVRSCILRHLLLKISEHYILSQFTPYLPLPQDLNINFLQCLSHFFSIENLAFWTNNISAFKSFLLLITFLLANVDTVWRGNLFWVHWEWMDKGKIEHFWNFNFFRLVLYKKETVMQCLGEKDGFLEILVLAWSWVREM